MEARVTVRDIRAEEFAALGELLVEVYSSLPGFPGPLEQPAYYEMLRNIGEFTKKPGVRVLVALLSAGGLAAALCTSGTWRTTVPQASHQQSSRRPAFVCSGSIRSAATWASARHLPLRASRGPEQGHLEVVLHTTKAMQTAWGMYARLGFSRSPDLDFLQKELPVFGFRLPLG